MRGRKPVDYRGKSVGGYTFVAPTAERVQGSIMWRVRCDGCGTEQAAPVAFCRLSHQVRRGTRRLCESPACDRSTRRAWGGESRRKILAAIADGDGRPVGTHLAKLAKVSRQRVGQIVDSELTSEEADAILRSLSREQLLANVMKQPMWERKMLALRARELSSRTH